MSTKDTRPFIRATVRAKWFAAAFAAVCAVGASLSWAGVFGAPTDMPELLLMSLGGLALFLFFIFMLRLVGR
jgi:hypothetical protein